MPYRLAFARFDNLNTSRPRTATLSGPSAQASWFPAISRSSWRAAPKSSAVAGSPPTRSPRHQRSSTPAAAMAPSTTRSRSWRPCTSEQTPILTGGERRGTRDSCQRGFEVAAVGLQQAGEQTVRAPIFESVRGPVAAEPDLEVAELVEHRGAQEQRATVDGITFTGCDH